MTVTDQDTTMWAGDAKSLQFTITDSAGAAYDLTGVTDIQWALSLVPNSDDLITKSLGSGIAVNSPATAGIFIVTLNSTDTQTLSGIYYHEARITDSSGLSRVVATGYITINVSNL